MEKIKKDKPKGKHIAVSEENYVKLLVMKGKKIQETEKEVSFDDVISDLLQLKK